MKRTPKSPNLIDYNHIARISQEELLDKFETTNRGLTEEEALERFERDGENVVARQKEVHLVFRFLKALSNPFNLILLFVATITYFTDVLTVAHDEKDYITVMIIVVLVLISAGMSFYQEERSRSAASELLKSVTNTVSVYRDDILAELLINDLVVGDIVSLGVGDLIPADIRFLTVKDTFISQSTLTGESDNLERFTEIDDNNYAITDLPNLAFMGSNMVSGSATAIVVATGSNTYVGKMAIMLEETRVKSSFERGVEAISRLLLILMMIMLPAVFLINGIFKGDWAGSFLFSLTLAVGLTPSLLPVVMSTGLGRGAVVMSQHQTIVKNLSGIQTFGEMDLLCTDKTGTLTEDEIILERYLDVHGNDDKRVLRHGFLNSHFQTGLRNLIDVAIIRRAEKEGIQDEVDKFEIIDEIPFDFSRRRMSVVIQDQSEKRQLITKGAVEEMLEICSFVEYQGKVLKLTPELKAEAMEVYNEHNDDGLRMIAVAQKNEIPDAHIFSVVDESEMVLIGFIGFLDPPKESAAATIKSLHDHGVKVVVLTGDSMGVAKKVCRKVGISIENAKLGTDIADISDEELLKLIPNVALFAKLSPTEKQRVVSAYQTLGHTVGYLGDGINDALSLKQADVGISVDSAVDVAKETADIILLEKDLRVLEEGIIEGRKTFGNIIKYIKLAVSGNFGNMIAVLLASFFLKFLPMLPIHILVQNLLTDLAQLGIPFDNIDEDFLLEPQRWETKTITSFMLVFGPLSSIFDIITFLVAWFILGLTGKSAHEILYFQTMWFTFGILSQVLIIHFIRTNQIPFIESKPALPLVLSTLTVSLVTISITFTGFAPAFELARLNLTHAFYLSLILLGYMVLALIGKTWYIKKFKRWL